MKEQLAAGSPAAEAARLAKLEEDRVTPLDLSELGEEIERAFDALDEPAAQAALDRLFGSFALDSALGRVIVPFLHRLGDRWARAQVSVADEHFASNVVGGRLRALARGWGQGVGPRAILACAPEEHHELGLLCFGLLLRERGWRIAYLGAATPPHDIRLACATLEPTVTVLAAVTPERFEDARADIRELSARTRVAIGGAGANEALAGGLGGELIVCDVVRGAATLAA